MNIFKEENKSPAKPDNSRKRLLLIGALVLMTTAYAVAENRENYVETAEIVEPDQVMAVNSQIEVAVEEKMYNESIISVDVPADFPTDDSNSPAEITESDVDVTVAQDVVSDESAVADSEVADFDIAENEIVVSAESHIDGEHLDSSPEPWVADEILAAEAKLYEMLPMADGEWTREYGYGYDETFGDYRFHQGMDMELEVGAIVSAPLAGVLLEIGDDAFYGKYLVISNSENLESRYYGIEPETNLEIGQNISAGDVLGVVTASPVFEELQAPHLHFEVYLNGKTVNPADYMY